MTWLAAALIASLLALGFALSRGLKGPALLLVVLSFALVFLLGRRIEGSRDGAWQELASRVQGEFQREPGGAWLARFGPGTPWSDWASDGELQCPRAITGSDFALLQIRYSVRQRRGEEQPDAWYEVSVAAVRMPPGRAAAGLVPVPADAGHVAVHNGEWLFMWKKGALGAGESLKPAELAALLERARGLLRRL